MTRLPRDFWIEMSIREIWTQAHFSDIAFNNLSNKMDTDVAFSSIHSFLSHCGMVSKMLQATDGVSGETIGDILGIQSDSLIHRRKFRNHLEHYDERLKSWIQTFGPDTNIGTYNIGPKEAFNIPGMLYISHYDPHTNQFTFINEDFNLTEMHQEVLRIMNIADLWTTKNTR